MVRAGATAEVLSEPLDLDPGLGSGVHLLGIGRAEGDVDPGAARLREISDLVAGVLVEILAGPELGGVDEDRDRDDTALADPPSTLTHEVQVTLMEGAHRRHERELGSLGEVAAIKAGPPLERLCAGAKDDHWGP